MVFLNVVLGDKDGLSTMDKTLSLDGDTIMI